MRIGSWTAWGVIWFSINDQGYLVTESDHVYIDTIITLEGPGSMRDHGVPI